jgi:D-alanyl-D-alanine carboxypeptidase
LADDYQNEQNRNEAFEEQIRTLAGTVGTLDRLAQIDKELLQKYSRVSFLNENYIPRQLTQIEARYVHPSADDEYFLTDAYGSLRNLLRAAERANLDLQVLSAYRSFEYQTELKGRYLVTYGEGANTFSADQGFSEHQLGTAVDFTTEALGGALDERFADSPEYKWLLANAHRYGFTLSYPEGNQFYVFEPWHWRFVGVDLARDLERDGAHFYDWDQRTINEYLIRIFE